MQGYLGTLEQGSETRDTIEPQLRDRLLINDTGAGPGVDTGDGKGSPTHVHGGGSNLLINRKELTAAAPRRDR